MLDAGVVLRSCQSYSTVPPSHAVVTLEVVLDFALVSDSQASVAEP